MSSRFSQNSERSELEGAIKRLGRFRVHPTVTDDRVSHVICGAARRTVNVLRAISRGLWLLSKQWVSCDDFSI